MKKYICAVFDSKAKVYGNPFYSVNQATAIRAFSAASNDPDSELSRHPSDFTLFGLGWFDDETGVISMLEHQENHGLATQFVHA